MATNPDDIKKGYLAYRQQQLENKMDSAQYAQPDDRSTLENAGRGVMAGLANAGYGVMGTVGKLLSRFGGQNVGDPIQKFAHDNAQQSQYFYDPHGLAGKIGEGAGHLTGNAATFMAGGELMGGAKLAEAAGALPVVGGAGTAAMGAALPGAAAHAAVNGLTARPETNDPGFWKTLRNDELGAGVFGGAVGMAKGIGGFAGKVGSKLASAFGGGEGDAVGDAIGQMPPAPPSAPAMAPDPVAPATEGGDFEAQVKAAMAKQDAPASSLTETIDQASSPQKLARRKAAQAAAPPREPAPENIGQRAADAVKTAVASSKAARVDYADRLSKDIAEAKGAKAPTPSTLLEQAPAPEPAAPTQSPTPKVKTKAKQSAKAETPKDSGAQDPKVEAVQPSVAPKKGGGKATAKPVEDNSGTGAQGAPKVSKSAPATKPAASKTPAATPVTRKNAVAERKGRIAPVAAKGGLTPEESTKESDNDSWLKTARNMAKGLTEGSPAHTKLMKQIAETETEQTGFAARRKAP